MSFVAKTLEKTAAIEVSAVKKGQIAPPVMLESAFFMSEFLALSNSSIVKHVCFSELKFLSRSWVTQASFFIFLDSAQLSPRKFIAKIFHNTFLILSHI
ncbi:hypothetical protein [Anaplasma phagocytophilum]|uniref:TRAP transporter, 4TM/12TM fusion domain protein n=3 Tax=Anaplasma phagocytophilum TaxID=948 RepID=A0A0F3MUD8_ANAPH|nr:hypothetical protein [Anaplasma phagocytophilum]ABD44263.1 hypothetical protein APH_1225 [Anaplasma phagocytophilum str. HZ]AGR79693.1 hypothetical protein YYU_05655 [Anaplasma phagocytophilum str. HZ2]AGR82210.1 hypothetical protein YYY_05730 [Anaplasma phagocytophilum str. Dog2]KJV87005.1 TRAP transporter, 4TM/12TM fusion domain protein [Anaplasma phagocytophilum str. ApNYW]KJV97908.1 TRAP transporter, 4TM/12TM fusion domain protein [Anaplasma phagocytophilum str. Annie]